MSGRNAELERSNLAADIAEPCYDGICIHHVRMEHNG